ncbi:MAG: helix-turn-helix domain-containing protein [Candidatus Eremiobacteraeota bacterium]|nr:helix-turn-helix domain-containing protein [Candidatus Eremiobacteraeota bacterium]
MKKRSSVASEILQGLEEVLAFEQGKISLKTREVEVPDPPKVYGAAGVRQLREQLGYSQAFLARVVGVSTDAVSSWEQGLRNPSRSAARILEFLEEPSLLKKFTGLPRKNRGASA